MQRTDSVESSSLVRAIVLNDLPYIKAVIGANGLFPSAMQDAMIAPTWTIPMPLHPSGSPSAVRLWPTVHPKP